MDFLKFKDIVDPSKSFADIANVLLNNKNLVVNKKKFRIAEIEFYYNSKKHPDDFAHGSDDQRKCGYIYFHKFGSTYKGGTYKGMDITFGNKDAFAGILIRTIVDLTDNKVIEGPCRVVNTILDTTDCDDDIKKLVEKITDDPYGDVLIDHDNTRLIYLEDANYNKQIYSSPRVGLTLKKYTETKGKYIMKHYRYHTNEIKKNNFLIQLANPQNNKIKSAQLKKFNEGKKMDLKDFIGKTLTSDQLCQLYGCTHK
ncbi:MAG: hypothetical protein Edafosvirus3_19 [Edafosvirus sp.]|uniref:Uncharacterized protein n=1 Tax=Edafosvirus sp. TaxID=2487765 RepID=A0A3G4ZVB3_9VIRU|nr:MAG: hypothetical protein Edafosvirus3_19 [Edafosvirus sp.]